MESVIELKALPLLPPAPLQYALSFFGFPLWKTTDSCAIAAIPFDVKHKQVQRCLHLTATIFDYKFGVK